MKTYNPSMLAEPRTFNRKGDYTPPTLNVRAGSLDFLRFPSQVNGHLIVPQPALKVPA